MSDDRQGLAKNRAQRRVLMSLAKRIRRGQIREAWKAGLPDNASESLYTQRLQADAVLARRSLK